MAPKLLLSLLIAACISGCSGPFAQYYTDLAGGIDLSESASVAVSNEEPQLHRGTDPEQDARNLVENGFLPIGFSSFNATNANVNDALTQAERVGAVMVVVYSEYTGTESGVAPVSVPDTRTTTTSAYGNVYGSRGYASFLGGAHTTTQGTKTVYVPYSRDKFDYLAIYWVKMKPPIFGVLATDLTPEIRRLIGSNKGVVVQAVIKDSPAFDADILIGDIIRQIAETPVVDADSWQRALIAHEGQKVEIIVIRDGKELRKAVAIRPDSASNSRY